MCVNLHIILQKIEPQLFQLAGALIYVNIQMWFFFKINFAPFTRIISADIFILGLMSGAAFCRQSRRPSNSGMLNSVSYTRLVYWNFGLKLTRPIRLSLKPLVIDNSVVVSVRLHTKRVFMMKRVTEPPSV